MMYWIPKGRTEDKHVLNHCMACKHWLSLTMEIEGMLNTPPLT